jgi:pimeloyl-ACP methyl ester carboxylesterase
MSTILIVLFLVFGIIVATSIALGRTAYEVESARDTEYLELEGTWIRYNIIGGGPPVLLVHGWLTSSRIWEQLATRLAQRFTVYTLDLTGFGESDKPLSGYGVRNGSRLLYAFCAHFGLSRTSVVAHDLGGNMAVKLAADHPDVVGRLVLVATPADDDQIDLPTLLWLTTLPVLGPIFYALGRLVRPVRRLWMRPFVVDPNDLTEEVVEDSGRSTPAAVSKTLGVARHEISRGRLARQARIIKIPLFLVAGEQDQIVDPQAVSVWARSVDKAETCLLEECGHLPMLERTAEFNAQILAFLTGDERYLEFAEVAHLADEEDVEDQDDDEAELLPEKDEVTPPAVQEDATDQTIEQTSSDVEAELSEDVPNVVRKKEGSYSARDREPGREPGVQTSDSSSGDGAEENRRRPPRARDRATPDEQIIPELPEDLFDWPQDRDEFRTRGRSTESPQDNSGEYPARDRGSGDPEDSAEPPRD